MESLQDKLKKALIEKKLLTEEDINTALSRHKKTEESLSKILVNLGLITERELTLVLSEVTGIPLVDLNRIDISPSVLELIKPSLAKRYGVIPISKISGVLTLATADPLNIFILDDLRSITGQHIIPVISSWEAVKDAVDRFYGSRVESALEEIIKDISTPDLEVVKSGELEKEAEGIEIVEATSPLIEMAQELIEKSIKSRASDLLIEPQEKNMRVRIRVDGQLRNIPAPNIKYHPAIISRIKVLADLDIAEHRLPQEGRFSQKTQGREVDFRVSIVPSVTGEKAALRILDRTSVSLELDRLGFNRDDIKYMKEASKHLHGMVLVCGPTGCGKTTTLYSTLRYINTPELNLVTVEDPVEYELEGINQLSVNPDIGLTFASALRSILRQDPDVIMVGEIRDSDTVDIAIRAALTGHLVLSSLHTTTAVGAIMRMINIGAEPYLLSSTLICAMAQRLIRKLCDNCKAEYTLTGKMAEKIGVEIPEGKKEITVYKPSGCNRCMNTGYFGRVGICEILRVTGRIRELIHKGAPEYEIRKVAEEQGMGNLRKDGLQRVFNGETSLEEVLRITASS